MNIFLVSPSLPNRVISYLFEHENRHRRIGRASLMGSGRFLLHRHRCGTAAGGLKIYLSLPVTAGMDHFHDLQHMQGKLAGSPQILAAGKNAVSHIPNTQAPGVFRIAKSSGVGPKFAVEILLQHDLTAEAIGVGYLNGTPGAVNLDPGQGGTPNIKGGDDVTHSTVFKPQQTVDMGGNFYIDDLSVIGLAGDPAGGEAGGGHACHAHNAAHQTDQSSQVVRTHIEHGAAADLVVEGRVGMPGFMPVAHHEGIGTDDIADQTVINDLAAGLDAAAKESIGGAT